MKIAFDVDVLAKQMDINRMVHQVADCSVFGNDHTMSTCKICGTDDSSQIMRILNIIKKNDKRRLSL